MKKDGDLPGLFRSHLKAPEFDWTIVETGGVSSGVPDHNCCSFGVEFWVEFKRSRGLRVPLRPLQVAWIHRRVRAGGRVWVAFRRLEITVDGPLDELWLVSGEYVRELAVAGLMIPTYIAKIWIGGPYSWDWREVAKTLRGD